MKDNQDETYAVRAPLVLEGSLTLEVKLVVSLERIAEVVKQTEHLVHFEHDYIATLVSYENTIFNVNIINKTK